MVHPTKMMFRVLGLGLWFAALGLLALSTWSVQARASRPCVRLNLQTPGDHCLTPGDGVFASGPAGLRRIGEVVDLDPQGRRVAIDIRPLELEALNGSTLAVCWRTPLGVEDALTALLPQAIQERVAQRIARDWRAREQELLAIWKPIAAELTTAYLEVVADDLHAALLLRDEELMAAAAEAVATVQMHWPAIQRRLNPILHRHLTPVLSRLMDDALDQAPKTRIAWHLFRNNSGEAFNLLLDWQADYLAELSDRDRQALSRAFRETWAVASQDPVLVERFKAIGRDLRDHPQLIELLEDLFRETFSDNPKTAEFFRCEVLQSARIRQEMYRLIEWFAPTARSVAAACLFDDDRRTRPEIVHLLRSIALRREVSWVSLSTPQAGAALQAGATLPAEVRGGHDSLRRGE